MLPKSQEEFLGGIQVVARLHYLWEWGRNSLMRRVKTCMVLLTLAAISCGCPGGRVVTGHTVVAQRPVAKDATREELLVGPVAVERSSSKPIENLRPQHLLDALLWPEIRKEESVTLREFNDENARYYVLTVLRGGYQVEVLREIWFDRADLHVARILN